MTTDYLVRALAYGGQVRAYAARTTATVSEAQRRHDTWPTATAALGRSITAGALMGAMLKGDDKLTIKIEGRGPMGAIIVDSDAAGHVRGYASHPHVDFELNEQHKLDVRRAVGQEGTLTVVKDLGMRDFFTGQVPIVSGELGEDFAYYFAVSEQVPSSVGVGVLVNPDDTVLAAGGFIAQLMPGAEEETIAALEARISAVEPISHMIRRGLTPEQILAEVLGEKQVEVLDQMPVSFRCTCSKERFARAIISLGAQEIQEMLEEEGQAEAQCHFCMETYHYSASELESFLHDIQQQTKQAGAD